MSEVEFRFIVVYDLFTIVIIFFVVRCFFVDDATKSNISVTSCPTVLFINQTTTLDLPSLQNTGNGSANEEPENFVRILQKKLLTYILCHSFYAVLICYVNACLNKNSRFSF